MMSKGHPSGVVDGAVDRPALETFYVFAVWMFGDRRAALERAAEVVRAAPDGDLMAWVAALIRALALSEPRGRGRADPFAALAARCSYCCMSSPCRPRGSRLGVALEAAFVDWPAEVESSDSPVFDGEPHDLASLYHALPAYRLDAPGAALLGSARAGPHA